MKRPVCREQPVAQEPLGALKAAAFHKPVVMCQQYVFNGGRVIEEKRESRAQSKGHDLVRAPSQLLQERKRVGFPATEGPEGARWVRW
jgi:hypothetical protein